MVTVARGVCQDVALALVEFVEGDGLFIWLEIGWWGEVLVVSDGL